MAARVLDLLNLWRNPVFRRFCRSRLRLRKAVFWYLLVLIVATFQALLTYIIETNQGRPPVQAARDLWIGLIVIQGLVLMIKGTGAVSAGLIQDKLDETLDYQRLTPVSPLKNLLGYLFGLPVLEYVMFALTLPHLALLVAAGDIPLVTVGSVYLAFFSCVVLYHMTGIAAGMVMKRWIFGYLLSIVLVIFVNLILPTFISQVGLKFLQYLSVWPVISQKVLPLIVTSSMSAQAAMNNPFLSMADSVPFYNWTLTPFVFTLLLQGALIVTFATMALRRWASSTRHSLSKPYALAFLTGFIVLLMGNVWPVITGQGLPFAIFGVTDIDQLREGIAIGLPLVYCSVVWLLCLMLFSIVLPSHHAYVRGIRRALKHGRAAAPPWDDDSASLGFMGLFLVAVLAGLGIIFYEVAAAGFLDFLTVNGFRPWRLPAALGLIVLYSALLLLVLELKASVLVILLTWFVPMLASGVLSAAVERFETLQAVVASASPIFFLVAAGLTPVEYVPGAFDDEFNALSIGYYTGLAFISIQIAALMWRWRALSTRYYALCTAAAARA